MTLSVYGTFLTYMMEYTVCFATPTVKQIFENIGECNKDPQKLTGNGSKCLEVRVAIFSLFQR